LKYDLILADPPWRYAFVNSPNRAIENHYPTMTNAEICALPVRDIAADNCVLFLWTTTAKLAETFAVVEAWGFEYVTSAIWDKEIIGMGYYFRGQHEFLLVCKRGKPKKPAEGTRPSSVIHERRTKHSKKPVKAYEILEAMYPDAKKVELFARQPRAGWDAWGNEVAPTPEVAAVLAPVDEEDPAIAEALALLAELG
jgi:N6-adenosine-specific RNA methylase IME4